MFDNRVISLAGVLSEKKLSAVKAKWSPPEGFFSQSSTEIVKGLLAAPGGHAKAMSRLNFYINRAGKKLDDKDSARLEKAKDQLSKKLAAIKEEAEMYAHRAGVVLEKKHDDEEPDMDLGDEAPAKDKKKDDDEEETLPKIVLKIAKKAVGKSEEDLADLLMKVYETGFKDGVKSTEEDKDDKNDKAIDESTASEGKVLDLGDRVVISTDDPADKKWNGRHGKIVSKHSTGFGVKLDSGETNVFARAEVVAE